MKSKKFLPYRQLTLFIAAFAIISLISTSLYSTDIGFLQWLTRCTKDAKDAVCKVVETAESTPIRLLFVFLLGILMSLTPCIYPMITITVGVLQAHAGSSFSSHFIRALSYTLGMATTFALFGFIAALSGNIFGQLMTNPFFIIFFVILLGYLALSMFGLYEIRLPRFLAHQKGITGTSPLSAFLFGAASGGVASPCLSPGLALVLSMVATMGNKFLGLLTLFIFGIGTSLPLLIVGTFSGTIGMLPKAGHWMLEVKKIFGFLLFGMCFYYLNNILPTYITLALMAIGCSLAGIYYFCNIKEYDSDLLAKLKNLFGLLFIIASVLISWQSFKVWVSPKPISEKSIFRKDFAQAYEQAKTENKKLFIDFGAYYCTSCKYIEHTILKTPIVEKELERFIPVYVDGSDVLSEPFATLKERYTIIGFPTLLLIDQETGDVIQKWGGELTDTKPEEFARELKKY